MIHIPFKFDPPTHELVIRLSLSGFRRKRGRDDSDDADLDEEQDDQVGLFMRHSGVRMAMPSVTGFIPSNSRVLGMPDPDNDPDNIMNQVAADSIALAFDNARQLAAVSSYGHISLEQQMEHARHFANISNHFAAIQAIPPPPIAAPAMVAPPPPIASPAMVSMHTPQGFAPINPIPVSLGPQMTQLQMTHELQNHQVGHSSACEARCPERPSPRCNLLSNLLSRCRIPCSISTRII